ncbi:MAG: 16S rRNA (cytosine(1402)-N(4))-methyltransferase RsmH [Flavobacteriales bacterium]|nr:16S rRNA (cytosine(1402)-N(4))-methyltransferase RsmH [Flavobacteriales bacterium]
MSYHEPVLLRECIEGLNIRPEGTYVDVTFGGGGHSREILSALGPKGRLIAFDQDSDAQANAIGDPRFTLVPHNFRYIRNFLKLHKAIPVDGILADLGISSHQIDAGERGFSTRLSGPLDMRMNTAGVVTAADIINTWSAEELSRIFREHADLNEGWKLAKAIVAQRESHPFATVEELRAICERFAQRGKENSFLSRVFQAIRIAVNDELNALREMLTRTPDLLAEGGRLVVISYHSLEDRMVKDLIRSGNVDGKLEKDFYGNLLTSLKAVNRSPIVPTEEELARNPRSRSAKLRIAERI